MEPGQGPSLEPGLHSPGPLNSPAQLDIVHLLLSSYFLPGIVQDTVSTQRWTKHTPCLMNSFLLNYHHLVAYIEFCQEKKALSPGVNHQLAWDWQLSQEA